MKGLLIALLCVMLMLPLASTNNTVASAAGELTEGIALLREKENHVFGNSAGSAIRITGEMIRSISGEDTNAIRFTSLPSESSGRLEHSGSIIRNEDKIQLKNDTVITFVPHRNDTLTDSFSFAKNNDLISYQCALILGDSEPETLKLSGNFLTTYKNISVFGRIRSLQGDAARYVLTKSCKNGIVTWNETDGSFRYTPNRNFTGKDEFSCIAQDVYGNKSAEACISIQVIKAERNLYFYDCKDSEAQKCAVFLCSKGIMNYHLDESGLPIFSPSKAMTQRELLQAIGNLTEKESIEANAEDTAKDAQLTKEQAYALILKTMSENPFRQEASTEVNAEDEIEEPFNREDCAILLYALYQARISDSRN